MRRRATSRWTATLLAIAIVATAPGANAMKRDPRSGARGAIAAGGGDRAAVVVRPIPQAAGFSPADPPAPSQDPRAHAIAGALAARLPEARLRAHATAPVAIAGAQRDALDRLDAQAAGGVRLRVHPGSRVPRHLEGSKLTTRRQGERPLQTARSFLRDNKKLLRLADPDGELVLRREQRDALGRTHLRFRQRHRGLDVEPSELIVHLDRDGDVDLLNGSYAATPDLDVVPSLQAADAIERARGAVEDGERAEIAAPRLFVWTDGDAPAHLAFDVRVPVSLAKQWRVVVDAHDGAVLAAWNTAMDVDVAGSGVDLLGATQPLHVWSEGGGFFLVDTSKPMFVPSSDPPNANTTQGGIVVVDAVNQPPTNDPQFFPPVFNIRSTAATGPWRPEGTNSGPHVPDGISALANFSRTYDYFRTVHNRNSLDDQGGQILAIVRLGQDFHNAFFNNEANLMAFGDAQDYAGSLDVVGHELSHGVTFHSANLVYKDEPGALNEAFSDIFGEMVEAAATGDNDWLLGPPAIPAIRNMANPAQFGDPAKYSQRLITNSDNGGVHSNSGILNHAFYQLVEGFANHLTRSEGERIFYRALTVYLTANSQFVDARLACIRSAEDLFGAGSPQAQRVAQAFDFVEVFDGQGTTDPDPFPGTEGSDATIFVRVSPTQGGGFGYFLYREEFPADPVGGTALSVFDVMSTRPSVDGSGLLAYFVDSVFDLCVIATEGGNEESCLGFPGEVASVSVSPDGEVIGFVLRDPNSGLAEDAINVIDFRKPEALQLTTYELRAPVTEGDAIDSVLYADAMDIAAGNEFLVYDALNSLSLASGGATAVWSVYLLELATGDQFALVPPVPGLDIAFPALAQTSNNYMTFEVFDEATSSSDVFTTNLNTGDVAYVGTNPSGAAIPGYTGDDATVVYSWADDLAPSGVSLIGQDVQARMAPVDDPYFWTEDADFGVVYRRGTFVPEPAGAGLVALAALAWLVSRRRREQ